MRRVVIMLMLGTLVWAPPDTGVARESAKTLSRQALKECNLGRQAKERAVRLAHFQKGQGLAERAVTLDERHAGAHFALFCSLGEQLRIDGENLTSVFGARKVMGALDRTLELDPNHLEALTCKGTLLVRLPALLGGDPQKGEEILQEVIKKDRKAVSARLTLARIYAERGDHEAAIRLAARAVKIAKANRYTELIPAAETTLAELRQART
ncbi:MAG: tetratricopeptide repeat protein [Nitrospiraceae bacterium]